ncbi:hypothetical protein [Streptomyces sp. RKAG293]|uniref:hypothetical protein n=1 Tax=Streptomyces sp. RKAG293 TaxID=2893403 RepID=UPI002033BA48|nr:hypothetical protein [Streptomyces sp. RKAG293]MCM2416788.1 hypothetical protein [Streptomyces sp. RKAG293]
MKVLHVLTGLVAGALVFVGAGGATAQTVTPHTGSTGCTSFGYLRQHTTYHGVICYTNTGDDDVSSSGFWTSMISTGCNAGYVDVKKTNGTKSTWYFGPAQVLDFASYPSGVASLQKVHIEAMTC